MLSLPYPSWLSVQSSKALVEEAKHWVVPQVDLTRFTKANVAIDSNEAVDQLPTGVYWGWASVNNGDILPMATSIGWNPYFADVKRKTFVCSLFSMNDIHSF